jgi:hypothetical protein
MEIRDPHVRQRPRRTVQLTTGMFSYQLSARLHEVQCDPGHATDSWRGNR